MAVLQLPPNGDIIFGGDHGYISISPGAKPDLYKPNIHLTSLEVNNKKINAGDALNGNILLAKTFAFPQESFRSSQNDPLSLNFEPCTTGSLQ